MKYEDVKKDKEEEREMRNKRMRKKRRKNRKMKEVGNGVKAAEESVTNG